MSSNQKDGNNKQTALRVLLIEDSEDDAELVLRALRKGGYLVEYDRVDERGPLRQLLANADWDIVLSDYAMPRFNGLEALRVVQESGMDLPFIVISGTIGEEVAVEMMKAGAHDYMMKNNLARLVPAVQRELRDSEVRHARRIAEETLRHQAYHDILTGLPNRWLLQDRLIHAMAFARREQRHVALLFFDLDRFKNVNDTLGHLVGDQLLRAVTSRLLGQLRDGDTLARLSGDDFIMLLGDLHHPQEAASTAAKLLQLLEKPFNLPGREVHIDASIGIALFPGDGADAETLLKHSEFAMYHAKAEGRNNYQFFTADIHAEAHERFTIEHDLHRAVKNDELILHYQPQVLLTTGEIFGVEALVRWMHPENGLIPPNKFIPVAEETGLIMAMSEWVLRKAVSDYCKWRDYGIAPERVAVNLSARQLHQSDTVRILEDIIQEADVDPRILEIEITESSIMQDPMRVVETISAIKALGPSIAIDDFGTGYSSLSYLRRFPIDVLKIDQSFVRDIHNDPDDAAIVATIIAMARTLNLTVIAEGVENKQQDEYLRNHGCEQGQGYLYAKPMPDEVLCEYLTKAKHKRTG